jgi:anti-sigma factor RsiW
VNCSDFHQRITPAVDRHLDPSDQEAFLDHASKCPPCRSEYEMELGTKRVVCRCMKMQRTPSGVVASTLEALNEEGHRPWFRSRVWWRLLLERPATKPAIAFAIAGVAFVVIVARPGGTVRSVFRESSVAGSDIIAQSLVNYQRVLSGMILPQKVTADAEEIREFLVHRTTFPILVPRTQDWTLVGGAVNDHEGVPLAHLMYRSGTGTLYVFETCWKTVQRGEILRIPEEIRTQLLATGWYSAELADGESLVLWATERTLCAAVSHMPKEELKDQMRLAFLDSAVQ